MDSLNELKPSIQRTFRDLSREEVDDVEKVLTLTRMGWSGAFGWDRLLESQRVLLVSEAGAGKTHECRAQRQALWDQGEAAFYLDLAQLATNNLRDLLSADEEVRLELWMAAQSDMAVFFLDSIDELKLTLGSFETALKRLAKAISGQLGRARIVITTRPIAVDQQLIQRHFPVPDPVELTASGYVFADVAMGRQPKGSSQDVKVVGPVWRNVALMPLSDEQVLAMAAIEGIDNPEAMLADIRARNATDFARRPQDLIELCLDWREHRRIRTHREQVAHNINIKLRPRTDRREPAHLSPDKALEGASRLALAALLTRKLTMRLSSEADKGGQLGTALDPAAILHDWTHEERETLLERALFGFASYGRVRFHHRSVVEFLAAQRIGDRLSEGMPIKAVKRLLFAETMQGVKVVRPTMRPVAAWLAASQPTIFSELRDREPNVLLDHADPESLTHSQCVDALYSYVRFYGQGGWRGLHVPRVQVDRFASSALGEHVRSLWEAGIENHEVRAFLLELIGAGPMPVCADIAFRIALDEATMYSERLNAISALVRLNDSRIDFLTQSMVDSKNHWSDLLLRGAIVRLFPKHITSTQLCSVLSRTKNSRRTIDEIEWLLPRNIAEFALAPDYLLTLCKGLTDLVTEGIAWNKDWPHLASSRVHLLPALAAVCRKLALIGETNVEVLRSSAIALRLKSESRADDEPWKDLCSTLAELPPKSREALFWVDDAFQQGLHPQENPWRRLFDGTHNGPLRLNFEQDGAWVHRILADGSYPFQERAMMLYASMHLIRNDDGDLRNHIEGFKQYVADSPELLTLINDQLAPRSINSDDAARQEKIKLRMLADEEREAKDHESWVAFWTEVVENPEAVFSPDRERNTAWDLWQVMHRSGKESRSSGWNRRFIEQHFGKVVADRLRKTMQVIWRVDRPTLRSERPSEEKGTYLVWWELGLAGISAEAEDPKWARMLSFEEASLATRYAPIMLNGFPSWLEALAREHPEAIERTLGPELSAEIEETATPRSFDILLQNVAHAPAVIVQLLLPRLGIWLDAHAGNLRNGEDEAASFERHKRVIQILLDYGDSEMQSHIRLMAVDQLKGGKNSLFAQLWLTTLMNLDPVAGVDALERLLTPLDPAPTGTAIDIFGNLFGDKHRSAHIDLGQSGFTPKLLFRLIRLAYRYVRVSDDISHEGSYSPGPRDHAQRGRNTLLDEILKTIGTEAWAIKSQMIADPLFAHFRDRLALLAQEKAAEEVDSAVLTESDVVALNRYGEAPPMTRDDMFALLIDRLDGLDELLLQDDSPRDAWALIKEEKVMRREIARELRNASNHVYTVDQEAVTADEKETDIRLRAVSSHEEAMIELKIGEGSWSGRNLRDTIKNQLVTRYMASECCRSGCLFVTVASDRTWEHPDTREVLDLDGLRAMLNAEAAMVVNQMGGSLRLIVKVFDLRPRLIVKPRLKR